MMILQISESLPRVANPPDTAHNTASDTETCECQHISKSPRIARI